MKTWHMTAYYGPEGRYTSRGKPNRRQRPGERPGDLAIQTHHTSESSRDIEAQAARDRPDIGRVETWETS